MAIDEKELEKILKALANKRRIAILKSLKNSKRKSVGTLADSIKLSFKSTSRHLGILYSTGLVDREQVNLTVYYRFPTTMPKIADKLISTL
jgi:DNA-binding transcriptional ArsR family regulator